MRRPTPLAAIDVIPWRPGSAPGIEIKELNFDPATGARSALLRSKPRPSVEHKAQFHAGEEEFYCLEGEFTFDGIEWFRPGSYVHFPVRTVHGARVQVPAGYLIYLRTTGDAKAQPVPMAYRESPYALDDPNRESSVYTHVATTAVKAGEGSSSVSDAAPERTVLRTQRSTTAIGGVDARVELLRLTRAQQATPTSLAAGAPVELFLAEGVLELESGATVAAPAYGFDPSGFESHALRAVSARAFVLVHIGTWV